MSFSQNVKEAICSPSGLQNNCCRRAFLAGILAFKGMPVGDEILLHVYGHSTAVFVADCILQCFSKEPRIYHDQASGVSYTLRFSSKAAMKILEDVEDGEGDEALRFRCSECRAAFLRGMFLGCGRLTDPAKHYLLEFSVGERADFAEKFLWSCDLTPKCTVRRSETILFLSHASAVEEFLVLAGLNSYAFSLMNARISHDMATQTIRITNCEMGNLNRSVTAAVKQTEAMRVLIEADKLGLLPPELQETVRARLAHPEMSLASLAATFSPPLTKSGLAHRLSKIESVAVRLLEEK